LDQFLINRGGELSADALQVSCQTVEDFLQRLIGIGLRICTKTQSIDSQLFGVIADLSNFLDFNAAFGQRRNGVPPRGCQ